MDFIKLTATYTANTVYIKYESIISMMRVSNCDEPYTAVSLSDGGNYNVAETPDYILNTIAELEKLQKAGDTDA